MTAYLTCRNCVLEKQFCQRRAHVKAAISGLGITSLKFRCPDRAPVFPTGCRVSVSWPVNGGDSEYPSYENETWSATVVGDSRGRILIKVDDADSDYETPAKSYVKNPTLFARVSADRLRLLDEPDRDVCPSCQRVDGGGIGENGCYAYAASKPFHGYRPGGCIASVSPMLATDVHELNTSPAFTTQREP